MKTEYLLFLLLLSSFYNAKVERLFDVANTFFEKSRFSSIFLI